MTHVTCKLTAKNRDQLRNPHTLGNRVWASFTLKQSVLNFCSTATRLQRRSHTAYCATLARPVCESSRGHQRRCKKCLAIVYLAVSIIRAPRHSARRRYQYIVISARRRMIHSTRVSCILSRSRLHRTSSPVSLKTKFHYTDPIGPARTFFAAKLRWVRAGPVGSV